MPMSIWAVRLPLQQGRTAARPGQGRSGPQPREPGRVENGFGASGCPQAPQPLAQPAQRGRHPDAGERTPAGHCAAAWEGGLGQNLALEPAPPAPRLEQSLTLGCALGHAGEGAGVPVAAKCAGVSVHVCVHVPALVHAHFGCVSVHACVHASACACVGWLPVVPAAPALPPRGFPGGAAAGGRRSLSAAQARGQAYCQKHILHCDIL